MKPAHRRLLLVALATLAVRFAWDVLHALDVFADYHAYYRAAANLRAGTDIYAEGTLLIARNDFDFWTQTDGQYVYPPALAIAFLPLTILDIGKGGPVWLLALVLAALVTPWLVARLLGYPVGCSSFLLVALPVWAILPLALGIRYGLVATFPVVLAALALITYLSFARSSLNHDLPRMLRGVAETQRSPSQGAHPPQHRGGGYPGASSLALPFLAALALLVGWRSGQIDGFLLKLAAPGLVGTTALPWLRLAPFVRATSLRADLDAVLPLALPVLGATPFLLGLRFGQPDILLLLLTALALLAHLRRRDLLAGVALGAAVAVKPTLALYGLYYLKKRAWGTLCIATLTGVTLGLAPFLFLGGGAFADWFAISRYFTGDDYPAYPNNQSLRGLLLRAFVGGPQHTPLTVNYLLADLLWFIAVAAALVLWWRVVVPERQGGVRVVTEYALVVALVLVAAPLSEDIHYVALLLPLAVLADRVVRSPQSPRWRLFAIFAILAFILPLPALVEPVAGGALPRLLASAPYLFGLLLVIAALLVALAQERRQAAPS